VGIKKQNVQIFIYDISGRQILKLVDEQLAPGEHEVKWDASEMPSGTYFYKISAGNYSEAKKCY